METGCGCVGDGAWLRWRRAGSGGSLPEGGRFAFRDGLVTGVFAQETGVCVRGCPLPARREVCVKRCACLRDGGVCPPHLLLEQHHTQLVRVPQVREHDAEPLRLDRREWRVRQDGGKLVQLAHRAPQRGRVLLAAVAQARPLAEWRCPGLGKQLGRWPSRFVGGRTAIAQTRPLRPRLGEQLGRWPSRFVGGRTAIAQTRPLRPRLGEQIGRWQLLRFVGGRTAVAQTRPLRPRLGELG